MTRKPRSSTYVSTTNIGDQFAALTVIGTAEPYGAKKSTRWLCRCECGKEVITYQTHLRRGMTQSCGCRKRRQWLDHVTKHGKARTPEYKNWSAMKARCYNPNSAKFTDYGGRGITVCDRWKDSFENFLADMGTRPTPTSEIDRVDSDGNYEPSNCRWASRSRQNRNKRNTIFITVDGETRSLSDWCELRGLNYNTVAGRILQYGWNPVDAITKPPKRTGRRPRQKD